MTEQFERAGKAASVVFDGISQNSVTVASTVDGVATSVNDLQQTAENAASSTDVLAETMSNCNNTMQEVVAQTNA